MCETHAQNITVKETKWTLDKTYNAGTQDYTHWRQSGLWVQYNAATLRAICPTKEDIGSR